MTASLAEMMLTEVRAQFLAVLRDLEKKQHIVASQDDLRQIIRVLQYLLMEETILMGYQDSVPFEKGYEVGHTFASCFEMRGDAMALQNLGWLLAPLFGYDHTSVVKPFLMGLAKGIDDASPKLIEGK